MGFLLRVWPKRPWQLPQMAPMNWFVLYFLFLGALALVSVKVYYVKHE